MTEPKLDPAIRRSLEAFVSSAKEALSDHLRAVVLFGSAASGELRATSDVNVVLVLTQFAEARIDALREPLRTAHATIRLEVMFLETSEIEEASRAFADKFADIKRRRWVLFGEDPFAHLTLNRVDEIRRLTQTLLNLILRLRNRYAFTSLRDEQARRALAESAGAMRSAAAMLLDLEGTSYASPKDALIAIAQAEHDPPLLHALEAMSLAREGAPTLQGTAGHGLLGMIALAQRMQVRTKALAEAHS